MSETPKRLKPSFETFRELPQIRKALGHRVRWAGLAAYREAAVAAKGLEIAHLQFAFFELTLAVCSRVRRDGTAAIN